MSALRREYNSIKRFAYACQLRGEVDLQAVYDRYAKGESDLEFLEGQALGFKRAAELILRYIEDGEKILAEREEAEALA